MSIALIPLHQKHDGSEIQINIHWIVYILPGPVDTTVVCAEGSEIIVKETREEIDKLVGYMHPIWRAMEAK